MSSIIFNTNRTNLNVVAGGRNYLSLKDFFSVGLTFVLTVLGWIFFRSNSLTNAIIYIGGVFSKSFFKTLTFIDNRFALNTGLLISIFMVIEWLGREDHYAIKKIWIQLEEA